MITTQNATTNARRSKIAAMALRYVHDLRDWEATPDA